MADASTLSFALACVLATGALGCGEGEARDSPPDAPPQGSTLDLTVAWNDGHDASGSATLRCRRGRSYGTGYLRRSARRLCARRSGLARLLTATPPADRVCTEIYGGPSTARVTGRAGAREVDRGFTRTNGCEISDWGSAGNLLPPPS